MAKTPEKEVLKLVVMLMDEELENNPEKESFTTKELYDMVRVHMAKEAQKKGINFEDTEDMQTYKGRNTTKLLSTVQNLVSHKKLSGEGFNIEKAESGKGFKIGREGTGRQSTFDFVGDEFVIGEETEEVTTRVRRAKKEEYDEIRELMYKYLVVTTHIPHEQARAVIENISESSLLAWVNEVGGVDPHKIKMETGKIARERSKGISEIENYDEMVSLMMEAILSNKPTIFIRDYDNDGISCGSVMEVLLKIVGDMGIEHKVKVFQTIGGEIRGINEADMKYFNEMKELYPNEDLAYCFTMDNGVSSHEHIMEIYKQMGYKVQPKTGIIDHHAPDKDANLTSFLHFNPELDDNEVVRPSAGGMMAALAIETYKKLAEERGVEYSTLAVEHLQRLGEHANQADMVAVGLDHLPENLVLQTKAGQIGGLLNAYVKYENFFRNPEKFKGYLDQITDGDSHQLMQEFLFLSKQAQVIMDNRDKDLADIKIAVLKEKTTLQEGAVSPDSISDLRQFVTTNSYDTDTKNIELAEYALTVFESLKRLDKKISYSLRENKDQHIIGDYMVDGVFLRIYNPESKASTKAIDAAFPKPTTGYTISVTPTIEKDGSISFARGGYRSTLDGGHHNFEEMNNEILNIKFKGHSNAAGAFINTKASSIKVFERIMLNAMKEAGVIAKRIQEEDKIKDQIVRVSEEDIYQIEALSSVNTLFSAHLFAIKAGYKMSLKGDYLNRLLKNVDKEKPWGAIPLTFGGQVLIVPNKEYGANDNLVFNSLPGGSWITDGNTVDDSQTQILEGIYDQQSEEMKVIAEEAYNKESSVNETEIGMDFVEEVIGSSRGASAQRKGAKEAIGYVVRRMLDTNSRYAIVYDIESTGSTAGAEEEEGKSDESRMGKAPSDVINGQFVVSQITGGTKIPKNAFKNRFFKLDDGKEVLLTTAGYTKIKAKYKKELEKGEWVELKAGDLKENEYEEIYSVEMDKDPVVYNHSLETKALDYLVDIENEIPPSVVSLTHITNEILKKYGHDKEKINAELEKIFEKFLSELKDDEIITIAAHNIVFDARMTPQTLPFFKKLENHEKVVLIDTVHTVKAEQKRTTSFAQFEFEGFKKYVQVFKNTQGKEKLHNSYYVLEDFLLKKEEGYLTNLAAQNEQFEYRKNGSKLALLYNDKKTGKEQLIIDDVLPMKEDDLKNTIKYNVAKPTRYSMQLVMDLTTLNGMMFASLGKDVVKNKPLEGLFDTIQDKNLKDHISRYMDAYMFTYSQYQNMVYLRESIIKFTDENGRKREMHVAEYLKNMMTKKFVEEMSKQAEILKSTQSDSLRKEMELYFSKKKLEDFLALSPADRIKSGTLLMKVSYRTAVEALVKEKEADIVGMFEDFLLDNKDLAELYDLKVISHSILPSLKNLPWPLAEDEKPKWLEIIHATTGIDRVSLTKIVDIINKNANIMGESPFKIEPHANIGEVSDSLEEWLLVAYSNNKVTTPLDKGRTYHNQAHDNSLEILKTTVQRAKAMATSKMEAKIKDVIGEGNIVREGVTDPMLKTSNQRAYIIPKDGAVLESEEYSKAEEVLNGYYSILAYENSLQKMVKSLEKKYVAASIDKNGELILDEEFKNKVLKKKEEGKKLDDPVEEGEQLMYDCYQLSEIIKGLAPKKEQLQREITNNRRWEVEFNNEALVSRKLLDSTRDFFAYLLSKAYHPVEAEMTHEKLVSPEAAIEFKAQDPFVQELFEEVKRIMSKVIKADPKLRADRETYEIILHNFLVGKVTAKTFLTSIRDVKSPAYAKSFDDPFSHLNDNPYLVGGIKGAKNEKTKTTHP